jgi:putative phosphoribosyl transferase
MELPFPNRREGGRALAELLARSVGDGQAVVLALPRGGVPVGFEVAKALDSPLDVFLVRKLGVPGHEELAMGAIASGGVRVLNDEVVAELGIPGWAIERVAAREQAELERREKLYRGDRPPADVSGKVAILVDDGLATGASMRAAALAVRQLNPSRVVIAVPVAAAETCAELRHLADEVVCVATPEPFYAVGLWYRDFSPTSDQEVVELLEASEQRVRAGSRQV